MHSKYTLIRGLLAVTAVSCPSSVHAHSSRLHRSAHSARSKIILPQSARTAPPTPSSSISTSCKYCDREFPSRNAFFKHVRTDADCCAKAMVEAGGSNDTMETNKSLFARAPRKVVAFLVGYDSLDGGGRESFPDNERAAILLKDAFVDALSESNGFRNEKGKHDNEWLRDEVVFTQASATKFRPRALAPESACRSAGDVFTIGYRSERDDADRLVDRVNSKLEGLNTTIGMAVRVLSFETLSPSSTLHAERSATQYAYHYFIPFSWLPGGTESAKWWTEEASSEETDPQSGRRFGIQGGGHCDKRESASRSDKKMALKSLKRSLRRATEDAESADGDVANYREKAAGRFGALSDKRKRSWHNFADPSLRGEASPNNSPVWRAVDRAKTVQIFSNADRHSPTEDVADDVFAIVEIRGDGFLTQQARRMVGSFVAVANGWLPESFFSLATRPDVIIESPLAPLGLVYFAGARYDFDAVRRGRVMFEALDGSSGDSHREWLQEMRGVLLSKREKEEEGRWLLELENEVAPRIRSQIDRVEREDRLRDEGWQDGDQTEQGRNDSLLPHYFKPTVTILRDLARRGKWPGTSTARSRVIRSVDATNTSAYGRMSGSFTVVNPKLADTLGLNLPLGNELFPDVVREVFALEEQICKERGLDHRPPSSHCAVNRNAQFTPHVDSGRGFGQSLSMIVGLGDYAGGELAVEGSLHDILYKPLEFDGWRERHWTQSFTGERFSLVWFTPQVKLSKTVSDHNEGRSKEQIKSRVDDERAAKLVASHAAAKLPEYPLLQFRDNSTDSFVIAELLDLDKGSAYQISSDPHFDFPFDFSPNSHTVLDIGAHIGVFVRFALGEGAEKVIAFEPEPSNADLLKRNTVPLSDETACRVVIHEAAVAQASLGKMDLVLGLERNDGTKNTWRHSLDRHSHYKQKTECVSVLVRPFFGTDGVLQRGITYVKLDCEGAELDLLLSEEASQSDSWLDVSHLVLEWSFTKERRVERFHSAMGNLEAAGFVVTYEGKGSWWDREDDQDAEWPWHTDLVVFAIRQKALALE